MTCLKKLCLLASTFTRPRRDVDLDSSVFRAAQPESLSQCAVLCQLGDGRNDVGSGKPDWFLARQVVDSNILCCAVVDGPHGKNVIVRTNEREKSELQPSFSFKATLQRDC